MNGISLAFLIVTLVFLLIGTLNGLRRGVFRQLFRLSLVVVALLVTFWLMDPVLNSLLNRPLIDGMSLTEALFSSLPEEMASLSDIITPIITIALRIPLFTILFVLLLLVTKIIYCIFYRMLPKHTMRGVGALVGLLQGALIAVCLAAPFNGMLNHANSILSLKLNGEYIIPEDDSTKVTTFVREYSESAICKTYTFLGDPLFNAIASAKDSNGNKVSLKGQMEVVTAVGTLSESITDLSNIDFSEGLTRESAQKIVDMLNDVDDAMDSLSEEAMNTINSALSLVGEITEVPIDLSDLDLSDIDFSNEGELFMDLYNYQEDGSLEDISKTVHALADSALILPVLKNTDAVIALNDAQKVQCEAAIAGIEDDEAADALRKLFSLNP